jgi:hypothetical protein
MRVKQLSLLLFIIGLFACTSMSAQVPGYQGLRFSVIYNFGISPPTLGKMTNWVPPLHHNVSIEWVAGRRKAIGFRYCRTDLKVNNYGQTAWSGVYGSEGLASVINQLPSRFNSNAFSIYGKFFNGKGNLAPRGSYLLIGLSYFYSVNTMPNFSSSGPEKIVNYVDHRHDLGFLFGVGSNVMVIRRLYINMGIEANIAYTTFPYLIEFNSADHYSSLKEATGREVGLANMLQLHVGLGFLAF